jgi:DNA-binding CsgD family transcriptional regulator
LAEREAELAAIDAVLSRGGVLAVEAGAGLGKTSLLDEASRRALSGGRSVLAARCSALEAEFAFGVVRQLFERRLAGAGKEEREELLAGPAEAARRLLATESDGAAVDATFAVLHGLYWLVANLAERDPLLLVVDDVHWADPPSLRWLAHLAPRVEDAAVALLVALRPAEPVADSASMAQLRACATVVRPDLLTRRAVTAIIRRALGSETSEDVCAKVHEATGGNPFYVAELLRDADPLRSADGITRHVVARLRRLDPTALLLAQSLSVMGDACPLRQAATVAGLDLPPARRAAAALVGSEILADADPPRFLHPIVREAVDATLRSDQREALHHAAARVYFRDRAPAGQVAAQLVRCQPGDDPWVVQQLRAAAGDAMRGAAPGEAARLLARAVAEPPPPAQRVDVLRELARAEASAGRESACAAFEEALALTDDPRTRGEIALEIAETYAALFRWVDAVEVVERALGELGDLDPELSAHLEAVLVVSGLHDARRAAAVRSVLERPVRRGQTPAGAEALATGMRMVLTGCPAGEAAAALERALRSAPAEVDNWDARAALLWCLITVERFDAVDEALGPLIATVERSGSARGYVAVYSTLGLLKLRLGALPEADAAARIALRVLLEGDFAPGLAFGATVLADVAVEAGELDEADSLLALLPEGPLPPGVGSVLIPAARGRLRLAQRRWDEARHQFETCGVMFSADAWGMELRDVGYLHARSGAAQALLGTGRREDAERLAGAELSDVRAFGAPRALGIAARVAGLVTGGEHGRRLLAESVAALRQSPAVLERAKSLVELGAALRRAGSRTDARELLAEGLDVAARCGARPLVARAREELAAAGARPRRVWRRGVESLTPSELRVARLAAEGNTNRQIAQALYVTVKTVEGHLAAVYGKLGIAGRGELAPALRGEVQGGHPVAKAPPRG